MSNGHYGDITIDVSSTPYETGFKFNTMPFGGMTIDASNAVRIGSASHIKLAPKAGHSVVLEGNLATTADLKLALPAGKTFILETTGDLPLASEALRGALFLVRGGTGTPDSLVVCLKSILGVYGWQAIATG